MNKTQLIDAVAARAEIPKMTVKKSIDSLLEVVSEALRTGDKITLSGFGSFVICKRPARVGRNFRNGAPVDIPPKSVVKFRSAIEA